MFNNPDHPAFRLAGMEYRNFVYSPEYWVSLTDTDPRSFPEFFEVRNGLVGCKPAFRQFYRQHIQTVHANWRSLGVRHG